jgi:hypothetical protein
MIQTLAGGAAELDLTSWPVVHLRLLEAEALAANSEAAVDEMVDALAKVILSSDRRGMRFELVVDFLAAVVDIFEQCAPFILQFAMALARPDVFEASQRSMVGTLVRFHDPDDAPLVNMVAQLVAHVPQGAPIRFAMAESEEP